jgi:hypothetical protein
MRGVVGARVTAFRAPLRAWININATVNLDQSKSPILAMRVICDRVVYVLIVSLNAVAVVKRMSRTY